MNANKPEEEEEKGKKNYLKNDIMQLYQKSHSSIL